jgi:hypothetical protein
MQKKPKILLLDCETAPIIAHVWGLWNNDVGLNQIEKDWHILSWSAKWLDDPVSKIMYMDQRAAKNIEDDRKIMVGIWKLLNQADIIVTHNGKKFDQKKLNARFIIHGMKPPGTFKHIDTLVLAKKQFGFTSNKLEFIANALGTKHRKLPHKKFPGHELWRECLAGNKAAWKEMEAYNKHDVLVLEDVYRRLVPWGAGTNLNVYEPGATTCQCGGKIVRDGHTYTSKGKFQRYWCSSCGAWTRDSTNLLTKEQRKPLRVET